ncbi:glycosyltransferase [Vibrio mediterranei]|uniref:Glycosyltransferase n=1 Tax=Vibrio mediterranei TaxID=689 RepID=A0ABX5DEN9_9VIBR|nr:glycosyltransferase [Vibrio mediterranei]PCD87713.1 hypothetical protein COR52_15060 [Vibrio mediterranei]PRQ67337.1 hypothetical protein COR51_12245 [Vibrio mediterranei]
MKVINVVLNDFTKDSRVHKFSTTFAKLGYRVTVVGIHSSGLKEKEHNTDCNYEIRRLKLATKGLPKSKLFVAFKFLEFLFRFIMMVRLSKPQVIHANDIDGLFVGCFAKLFYRRVKVVYDSHEYQAYVNNISPFKSQAIKFLESRLIPHVEHVILVSDSIEDAYLSDYNLCPDKTSVIYNCPDFNLHYEVGNATYFREHFDIPNDKVIFLYQGALSYGRGIENILRAFSDKSVRSDAVCIFMGNGALEARIIDAANSSCNIFFHKSVPYTEIMRVTSSADVGLSIIESTCLSYKYALPNKLFEYIYSGLDIIVSNNPDLAGLVMRYDFGVILKTNEPSSLIKVINNYSKINSNEFDRKRLDIIKRYNWADQESTISKIYNSIDVKEV